MFYSSRKVSVIYFKFTVIITSLILVSLTALFAQESNPAADCSRLGFHAGTSYAVDGYPNEIVAADFNNDGRKDVAYGVSYNGGYKIEVQLGDGSSEFQRFQSIDLSSNVGSLTTGDFDADGILDLLVAHRFGPTNNSISLLAGDGAGHFALSTNFPIDGEPYSAITGDFNGDDKLDFAVADSAQNAVQIFYGDNNGNFATPVKLAVGNLPYKVAKADFNNDGLPDLIASNSSSNFVSVLIARPGGTFAAAVSVAIEPEYSAKDLSVGDFNGDGNMDAVVNAAKGFYYQEYQSGASILLGNGSGGFTLLPLIRFEGQTDKIWVADLNNDSKPDLLAGRGSVFSVRLGNGDATFGDEKRFVSLSVGTLAIEDFNNDGNVDLARSWGGSTEFQIFRGDGSGGFGAPVIMTGNRPNSVASADFNSDGRPDVVFTERDTSSLKVLRNNGETGFAVTNTFALTEPASSVFTSDFNSDGKPDIGVITEAVTYGQQEHLVIIINNGGTFALPKYSLIGRQYMRNAVVGDVTRDGIVDIVFASPGSPGSIVIDQGNGDGTFAFLESLPISIYPGQSYDPWDVEIGDFNRDGLPDIAATGVSNLIVFLGVASGNFARPVWYPVTNDAPGEFVMSDFNHDGILDAAVISKPYPTYNNVSTLTIMSGDGAGAFTSVTTQRLHPGTSTVTLADINSDQNPDLVVSGGPFWGYTDNQIGILYGSNTGVFSAPKWFVAESGTWDTAIADFNSDGKADIVVPGYNYGNISLLTGICPAASADLPSLSISPDNTVQELDSGATEVEFTVTLSAATPQTVSVEYYTTAGTAAGTSDYRPISGKLVFQPNETSKTVKTVVFGDLTNESDEDFHIFIANPLNASIADNKASVFIKEDTDPAPGVSIGDFAFNEGSDGEVAISLPVSLSAVSGKAITVKYTATSGSAMAGEDFNAVSGTITLPAGTLQKNADIVINGDRLVEPDETFFVTLSDPENAVLGRIQAVATIKNDDLGGNVQFSLASFDVLENTGNAIVRVTRANGNASNVSVQYTTSDGSAKAGEDYSPTTGTVTFDTNETSKNISVPIINDTVDEADIESLTLTLTAVSGGATFGPIKNAVLNIQDDDPLPLVRAENATVVEGYVGTTAVNVPIRLLSASSREVRVNYSLQSGTAVSASDYLPVSGTLIFAPGETIKSIAIEVVGDSRVEPNEVF